MYIIFIPFCVFHHTSFANSQGVVEEQYVFLKRVCQLLVHLGISQLAPLWVCLLYDDVSKNSVFVMHAAK